MMKRHLFHKYETNEKGSIIVEFALMMPLIMGLILILVQVAVIIFYQNVLAYSARKGVEVYALTTGVSKQAVDRAVADAAGLKGIVVESLPGKSRGSMVSIKTKYNVPLFVPLVSQVYKDGFPIEADASMYVESD